MSFECKLIFFSALLAIFSFAPHGICGETSGPESGTGRPHCMAGKIESEKNVGAWFAQVFRDHISRVDGDRCPSIPSCSSYSVMAFKKHGFIVGWLMTVDRLIHEWDEGSVSPSVYNNGRLHVHDPVENNDFWWFPGDGSTSK